MTIDLRLVRCEGGAPYLNGYQLDAAQLLNATDLLRVSKNQIAIDREAQLGLGDCLYFYVGHACPAFGPMVFVFDDSIIQNGDTGSVTDFDTGGLVDYVWFTPTMSRADKVQWATQRIAAVAQWRTVVVNHLANFQEGWSSYVGGARPTTMDVEGRFQHPNNERRAWTVEIQLLRDHPIRTGLLRIQLREDAMSALRQALRNAPSHPNAAFWRAELTSQRVRSSQTPHEDVEAAMVGGSL